MGKLKIQYFVVKYRHRLDRGLCMNGSGDRQTKVEE